MWIRSFTIKNYKPIEDSGARTLARGMNLVIGQNSSGKTAFLQAIAHRITYSPHRNSSRSAAEPLNPLTSVDFDMELTSQEARNILLSGGQVGMPVNQELRGNPLSFLARPEISISARFGVHQRNGAGWQRSKYPSNDIPDAVEFNQQAQLQPNPERSQLRVAGFSTQHETDDFGHLLAQSLSSRVYLFSSLRVPASRSNAGSDPSLAPNAANLPQVLSTFQPIRHLYASYIATVRRVLPIVQWVSVEPVGTEVEIRVWHVDDATGRHDLAVPLAECGTGVGQVLAILYVVMRSAGDVICIDEPGSFLHPRAAKELMVILNEHSQHQYVITTHSPEVVTSSHPDKVFLLKYENERTAIEELSGLDVRSAQQILDEIGSRFSDVFGADKVIWVEGPTEVECFPMLLRAAGAKLPAGVAFAQLANTDDLQGRHADIIAQIYRNLSAGGGLIPKAIAVSLDGDKAESKGVPTLKRACGDVLHFLPRWTYENYLLHVPSICALLNTLETYQEVPISIDAVANWIERHGADVVYGANNHPVNSPEWLRTVHGASLLEHLFEDVSAAKETYRKTLHSPALTRLIIERAPDTLVELKGYVSSLMPQH